MPLILSTDWPEKVSEFTMGDHPKDCDCSFCAKQRQFDRRVSAHIRDPGTWAISIGCSLPVAVVIAACVGGILWCLVGRFVGLVVGGATFFLAAVFLAVFFFYGIVLNAPFSSSYRLPGSPAAAIKDKRSASPSHYYRTCPKCKAKSEAWDWDEQQCGNCGFQAPREKST